jgi:hypothetical protein
MSETHNGGPTAAEERRAHMIDRLVVVGLAVVTAALSTYYTNVVTIGEVQSILRVHSMEISALRERQKDNIDKVEKLRIDQSAEDQTRIEILRRLTSIEQTQIELMRLLSKIGHP